jgi:hypothetical protein
MEVNRLRNELTTVERSNSDRRLSLDEDIIDHPILMFRRANSAFRMPNKPIEPHATSTSQYV